MQKAKTFYVYIMTNRPRSHVLYTGITGNLLRRVFEHKNKIIPGFTSRYNLTRLAYYESFTYPDDAIDREKEIKGWRRNKKIRLIESMNPYWCDPPSVGRTCTSLMETHAGSLARTARIDAETHSLRVGSAVLRASIQVKRTIPATEKRKPASR